MGLIIGCYTNFKKSGGAGPVLPEPQENYYTITTSELENGIQFSDLHADPGTYIFEQIEDDYLRGFEWVRFRFVPEKTTSIIGLDNLRDWRYFMICEGDDIFKRDYTDANGEYRADDYLFEAGHIYNILIQRSDNHPWTGTLTAEYPEDIHVTDRKRVNAIYIGSGLEINGRKPGLPGARENTSLQMDCVVKTGDTIFFGAFEGKYYNGAFAIRNEGDKLFVGLNNVANYHDFGEAIPMEVPVSVKLSQEEGIMEVRNLRHSDQIRYYNFTQNANWTRANLSQTIQLFGFNVGGISSETTPYNSLICSTIKLKGWEGDNEQRDIYPCQFSMSNGTEKYGFYNEWSGHDYVLRGARDASPDWDLYMDSTNDFTKYLANIESDGRLVFTANDYKGDYIGEIPFIYRKDGNYYRVNIYPDYNEETKQYQNTGTRKIVEELNPNTIDINFYFVLSYNDENTLWLDNWPNKWFDAFYGVPPLSYENFEPIRNNQEWAFREVRDEPEIVSVQHVDAVFIGSGLDINNQPINIGQAADETTTMFMDCVVLTSGDGVDGDARFFGAWDLNYQNGAFAIRNEGEKLYVGLSNVGNSYDFGEAIPQGIPVTIKLSLSNGEMSVTNMRNNQVLRNFDFKQNESWSRGNFNQPIQLFGFNEGGDSGKMTPNNGLLVSTITLDKVGLGIGPVGWPSKFTLADGSIKYGFENQLTHQYYILKDGSDGTTEWHNYINGGSEQSAEPNTIDEVN